MEKKDKRRRSGFVKPARRCLAATMAFLLAGSTVGHSGFGIGIANAQENSGYVITEVRPLEDDIAWQELAVGSGEDAIRFPKTLTVTAVEEIPVDTDEVKEPSGDSLVNETETETEGTGNVTEEEKPTEEGGDVTEKTEPTEDGDITEKTEPTEEDGDVTEKTEPTEEDGDTTRETESTEEDGDITGETESTEEDGNTTGETESSEEDGDTTGESKSSEEDGDITEKTEPSEDGDTTGESESKEENINEQPEPIEHTGNVNPDAEPVEDGFDTDGVNEDVDDDTPLPLAFLDGIEDAFGVLTVYAAEIEDDDDIIEDEDTKEIKVSWELNEADSDFSQFDSSEESVGAIYVYEPVLPDGYDVESGLELPQIAVEIVEDTTAIQTITDWDWVIEDEDNGIFQKPGEETGTWYLAPGGMEEGEDSLAFLTALLPTEITVTLESDAGTESTKTTEGTDPAEGKETIILAGWKSDTFVEDSETDTYPASGSHVFTAMLPEGYVLEDGAEKLEVVVELGGIETQGAEQSTLIVGNVTMNLEQDGYWKTDENGILTTENASATDYNVHYDASDSILTLKDATINGVATTYLGSGIYANIIDLNIQVSGTNNITGSVIGGNNNQTGVLVDGANLTIEGSGTLTVTGADGDAENYGIYATRTITITGEDSDALFVKATAGTTTHSLAGSKGISADSISIQNSVVIARGGTDGISLRQYDLCILENAVVEATPMIEAYPATHYPPDITGIIITGTDAKIGTVYGETTIPKDYTLPADTTLTVPNDAKLIIPAGKTLTVPVGSTLTNNGTIELNGGTLTVYGTLNGSDVITGNGTVERSIPAPTAERKTSTSVTLNAVAPTISAGGSEPVYYGYSTTSNGTITWNTNGNNRTINDLSPNTTYYFFVKVDQARRGDNTRVYNEAISTGTVIQTLSGPFLEVTAPKFEDVTVGYIQPDPQKISIDNTGNDMAQVREVAVSSNAYFTVDNKNVSVGPGERNTSCGIQPRPGLLAGTYEATITVTYDNNATATATVSFTVKAAETPPDAPDYAVTIQDKGNGATGEGSYKEKETVNIYAGTKEGYTFSGWTIGTDSGVVLSSTTSDRARFTMPGQAVTITALWRTLTGPSLKVSAPTFGTVIAGYSQPAAQGITIKNNGETKANVSKVEVSGNDFTVSGSSGTVAAGDTNDDWKIQPAAGLEAGTYTATITVIYDNNATATDDVSFTVKAVEAFPSAPNYAVTIQDKGSGATGEGSYQANDIVNIYAGTKEDCTFFGWTVAPDSGVTLSSTTSDRTSFTMPEKAVTITAIWKQDSSNTSNRDDDDDDNSSSNSSTQGTITNDQVKGQVHNINGIITGANNVSGGGVSHWFSEPVSPDNPSAGNRWKFQYANGTWASARMETGADGSTYERILWEKINGAWYAFDKGGYLKTGLFYDAYYGGWFYVDPDTGMKTGWVMINGVNYYFNPGPDGVLGMAVMDSAAGDAYLPSEPRRDEE